MVSHSFPPARRLERKLMRAAVAVAATWVLFTTACARVQPWQRERLASPAMLSPFGDVGWNTAYQAKVLESKTGGGLPGSAPGGGCGCTQ